MKFIDSSCLSSDLKSIYKKDDMVPSKVFVFFWKINKFFLKTKKLFEQYLPDPGTVSQYLDVYYAKNNVQNIQKH